LYVVKYARYKIPQIKILDLLKVTQRCSIPREEEMRKSYNVLIGKSEGNSALGVKDEDGRIILKCILKNVV
jgi:hypothetical protein